MKRVALNNTFYVLNIQSEFTPYLYQFLLQRTLGREHPRIKFGLNSPNKILTMFSELTKHVLVSKNILQSQKFNLNVELLSKYETSKLCKVLSPGH